jgi:hypothetical protein
MFPLYISVANLSWKFYNERAGMELCALLPIVEPDADWPGAGYKPGSDEHKDFKRYIQHSSLSIIMESARLASYTGFDFTDSTGVPRKGVLQIFIIQKDLGEAGHISGVKASHCDSCMVPPDRLNESCGKRSNPGWPARTEANMKKVINEMLDIRETPRSTKATVKALVDEHGVHPQMVRTKCPRPGHALEHELHFQAKKRLEMWMLRLTTYRSDIVAHKPHEGPYNGPKCEPCAIDCFVLHEVLVHVQ